jgi:hypothetical protein
MKIIAPLLLTGFLLAAAGAATAAPGSSLADLHADLAQQVGSALGPATIARIKPLADDAQKRISVALHDVGAHQQSPMQILTFGQKMSLRRARLDHTEPQLDLSSEQRSALANYAAAVTAAVAPIFRNEAAKIDVLLTPEQRSALDAVRARALGEIRALPSRSSDALPDVSAMIADDGLATNGGLVLLAEIDPRALMMSALH